MITLCRRFPLCYLAILLLLSGCGFHLKGVQQATPNLDGLYVEQGEKRGTLAGEIQRELSLAGVKLATSIDQSKYRLRINLERFGQRVISVDSNGKVLEHELRLDTRYDVRTPQGEEHFPEQALELTRQLVLSDADELGQRNEAALMRVDMRVDMAGQVIRQLQARLR